MWCNLFHVLPNRAYTTIIHNIILIITIDLTKRLNYVLLWVAAIGDVLWLVNYLHFFKFVFLQILSFTSMDPHLKYIFRENRISVITLLRVQLSIVSSWKLRLEYWRVWWAFCIKARLSDFLSFMRRKLNCWVSSCDIWVFTRILWLVPEKSLW